MRCFQYALPLTEPIRLGRHVMRERVGVLLELDGRWAEAAPLPHFSTEKLADTVSALKRLPDLRPESLADSSSRQSLPSLQFALDCLQEEHQDCAVPINALLQGDVRNVTEQAIQLASSDCRAVKAKVGRLEWTEEVSMILEVRKRLRPDQRLRLDANRAWDFATAIKFAESLRDVEIEYIEEPLQRPEELEKFTAETGMPFALDETLRDGVSSAAFPSASALVVKPMLLGGREEIQRLAAWQKPLVFSACYESGVGIGRIAQWAARYSPDTPIGLDTYRYLKRDVLRTRWKTVDWVLETSSRLQPDWETLQEIQL